MIQHLYALDPVGGRIRPEETVLLCCARTVIDSQTAQRVQDLLTDHYLDWPWLIRHALQHGVMPLLCRNLRDTCSDKIPDTVLNELESHARRNAARSLFLTDELLKLVDLFHTCGLSVIPFKGPLFASSIYGNLALRQFGDLDLLVPTDDYHRTQDVLRSRGYELVRSFSHESSFVDLSGTVCVDLHHALTPHRFPVSLNFDGLWTRRIPVSLCGKIASTCSPEDMLILLSIQVAKDAWDNKNRLAKICDLAELLRSHADMDWTWIIEEAKQLGCRRMLFLSLRLTHDVLGTVLQNNVWQSCRTHSYIPFLSRYVQHRLFHEPVNSFAERLNAVRFSFTVRERVRDKPPCVFLRLLVHRVFVPQNEDRVLLPLPKILSFLHYLIRPLRLFVKNATRLGRFIHLREQSVDSKEVT